MKNRRFARYFLFLVCPISVAALVHVNGEPTRLLRSPTVSATQIAFTYANNAWVVDRGGTAAPHVGEAEEWRFLRTW